MAIDGDLANLFSRLYWNYTDDQLTAEVAIWRSCKTDSAALAQRVNNFGLDITRVDVTTAIAAESIILQIQSDRLRGIKGPMTRAYASFNGYNTPNLNQLPNA